MHILVVGGGMGGTILANNLARRLSGELEQGSSKIMSPDQEKELEKALVNRIASNLTFTELIDIVTSLSLREVTQQLEEMTEEEKLQTYNEVFEKEV